jgi:hypothetical protein
VSTAQWITIATLILGNLYVGQWLGSPRRGHWPWPLRLLVLTILVLASTLALAWTIAWQET